jgi:hypothetical protein
MRRNDPSTPGRRWGLAAAAALALLAASAAPGAHEVTDLGFMSGCWRAGEGGDFSEEIWSAADGGLMIGLARTVRDGRVRGFELLVVRRRDDGTVALTPYPGGERSGHDFVLTGLGAEGAVFEAPEHDYPKRILYRPTAAGGLAARIDAGPDDTEAPEWAFSPAPCPAPSAIPAHP